MTMLDAVLSFSLQYPALFGGMLGALTTLVVTGVIKWYRSPRLVLDFDGANNAYFPLSTHPEGKEAAVTRMYLRVSVRTAGIWRTKIGGTAGALKCLIYLTDVKPVEQGNVGEDCLHDARPVSWPPNNRFEPRSIPRGITMFANVVTMKRGNLGWNFHVPDQYGLNAIRAHEGILRLYLTAVAENAKPVSICVEASIKADKSGFQTSLVRR